MSNKKQTSVEWLEMQIGSKITDANISISAVKFYDLINQAKEMEKQEIITAYNKAVPFKFGKEYYNETYEQ